MLADLPVVGQITLLHWTVEKRLFLSGKAGIRLSEDSVEPVNVDATPRRQLLLFVDDGTLCGNSTDDEVPDPGDFIVQSGCLPPQPPPHDPSPDSFHYEIEIDGEHYDVSDGPGAWRTLIEALMAAE